MIRSVYWIILTCLITVIVHLSWVSVVPLFVAERNLARFESLDEEKIVRVIEQDQVHKYFKYANPDMVYAYCKFDLRKKSLQINAYMPNTYWVINMYDDQTRNFYVLSNKQADVNDLVFLIKKKQDGESEEIGEISNLSETAININAKSEKGLVLLRAFVPFKSKTEDIKTKLSATSCVPI